MAPSLGELAASMWRHRPNVIELLFWTIVILAMDVFIGFPVVVSGVLVVLAVLLGTFVQARRDLVAAPPPAAEQEGTDES